MTRDLLREKDEEVYCLNLNLSNSISSEQSELSLRPLFPLFLPKISVVLCGFLSALRVKKTPYFLIISIDISIPIFNICEGFVDVFVPSKQIKSTFSLILLEISA